MPQFDILGKMARYDWNDHSGDPGVLIDSIVKPYVLPQDQQRFMEGTWTAPKITNISAKSPTDVASIIRASAQQYGLDPGVMLRIAQVESGLNPAAANPKSSARGVFQFTAPTWQQYGGAASPLDPQANVDAGMRLTRDNAAALRNALGRDPTPGELYLAHQQGAAGALKLLQNPSAPATGPAIELNGGAPGMTAGEFAQKWVGKFDATPQIGQMIGQNEPGIDLSPLSVALASAAQQQPMTRRQRPGGPLVLS